LSLEPGSDLAGGRYRLESMRGRGGMAVVWRAQDTQLERPVAIKVIADSLAADPEFRRRFEREARAAAAVSHPHVVKLFDYGLEDDRPYLVMEYVDGPNLAELHADGRAAALDADRLADDLLAAVCHIHRAGVVHRDIKPANLLMTPEGELRVTDFGIARLDETTQITRAGMVVGTERYIAPEVAAGRGATPVSDLYSCGAVLHELIAVAGGSASLRALARMLREDDPASRPQSADAALAALRGEDTTPLEGGEDTTARLAPRGGETAATAPLPAAPSRASRRTRPTAVLAAGRGRELARRALPVAAAAVAAALTTALVITAGDEDPERTAVPAPAPETAPAGAQVERLEDIVRGIGERQRP